MLKKNFFKDLKRDTYMFMGWKIQHNKYVNSLQIDILVNTIPIKISGKVLVDLDKIILKHMWEDKGTRITLKKEESGKNQSTHIKIYFIVTAIKIICCWWRNRNRSMDHKREYINDMHKCAHLTFAESITAFKWGEDSFFSKWCWSNWMSI